MGRHKGQKNRPKLNSENVLRLKNRLQAVILGTKKELKMNNDEIMSAKLRLLEIQ